MQKRKISVIGSEARAAIRRGVDKIADAVKITHGPYGRNYASGIHGGPIEVSNDGVSLAKEIQGDTEFEDMGVRAVREAATKTNDIAGDGTTGATILTQALLDALDFTGDSIISVPIQKAAQLEEETKKAVELLEEMKVPIESKEHLIKVAEVSVQDPKLAELIGGAQWEVGASGTVLAEEQNSAEDEVEFIYGVRIDNGFGTSRIANNQQKQALDLADMPVIVTNKNFNTAQLIRDMAPLFEEISKQGGKGVVLIGRAFDETAIGLCVMNIQKFFSNQGGFPIYPINAPYENQDDILEDLAAAVGAKFINASERNIQSITAKDVGTAKKVFATRYSGIIAGPKRGENEFIDGRVDERIKNIEEKMQGDVSAFEKKKLDERMSQLTVGTAVVKVGAETDQERKYKYDKVVDAVNAVKAAITEGVVPGAGLALKSVADKMPGSLIGSALRAPYDQIMRNAGGEFEVPEWVQDPLVVVKTGLQKASSIARSLATTEVLVTWEWEKPQCQHNDPEKTENAA